MQPNKQCFFTENHIDYIDYKDIDILKRFLNPSGRITSRKRNGNTAAYQRQLAEAIKRARFMGLLPFVVR